MHTILIQNLSPSEILGELNNIDVDPIGIKKMLPKFSNICLKIKDIDSKQAIIIKQEVLSKGGEAAYSRNTILNNGNKTDLLISGTKKTINELVESLIIQPFGLKIIGQEIKHTLEEKHKILKTLKLKHKRFDFNKQTYIMGILNLTPDSFYDGGKHKNIDSALRQIEKMIKEGADIIDIGGESSRPGSKPVSSNIEIKRTLPVIKAIKKRFKITLSIDTYKPKVATAAIREGAEIINDISSSPKMIDIASSNNLPIILMHMQNKPHNMQKKPSYKDVLSDVLSYLKEKREYALKSGLSKEKIIIDPGIGFGKNLSHNIILIKHLNTFKSLGSPILIGLSRKSMIGQILKNPNQDRLMGTAAIVALAINNGANIVRVHDVGKIEDVVKVVDFINRDRSQ